MVLMTSILLKEAELSRSSGAARPERPSTSETAIVWPLKVTLFRIGSMPRMET